MIEYFKKEDGTFDKVVTETATNVDVSAEIAALTAQVADMRAGTTDTPEAQAVIDAMITNYEAQIAYLENLD